MLKMHSSIILFQTDVAAVQRAVTEMPAIIHAVHRVVAEWLASKFVTLRNKTLVTDIGRCL
jgi:hypothetical protein